MAYDCSICGESLPSDGARRLHDLVAHVDPPAPPPPLPAPPPSPTPSPTPPGAGGGRFMAVVAFAVVAAIVSGALAALVVGRSGRSSPSAEEVAAGLEGVVPASDRPGFRTVSKLDQGFSIDLPESMSEVPLTPEGLAQIAGLVESLNPAIAGVLEDNDELLDHVRLFAIDPESGSTQLIQRVKAGQGVAIDDVPRGAFSDQYRELGAVSADEAMVQLPAGEALLVSVQLPMASSTVTVTQYVLARDGHVWVLTSSGPNSAKDAADIASTFRFL